MKLQDLNFGELQDLNFDTEPTIAKTEEATVVETDTTKVGDDFILSTPEQQREWDFEGKMGWWEYAGKTKGRDFYYGDIIETTKLWNLKGRLEKDEYATEEAKQSDMADLKDFILEQEEMSARGMSIGAGIYKVVANIPSFA